MRADIHDGQGAETLPAMGRIQMRETNYLQIVTSGLHRTAGPYTWSSDPGRPPRDGAPSCVTTPLTSRPWTYSLLRPLASTCSTPSSSSDWPAETLSGLTSHLIQPRTGSHGRSRRHSLGMRPHAT